MSTNDELQKRMAEQMEFVLSQTPEALAAENAKLRELVRDMHAAICELCARQDCDTCKLRDEGACERGVLTARACVLGIEVGE